MGMMGFQNNKGQRSVLNHQSQGEHKPQQAQRDKQSASTHKGFDDG